MSASKKFLYALPLLVQILCIVMLEVLLFSNLDDPSRIDRLDRNTLMAMVLWLGIATLASLAGLISYILYMFQQPHFPASSRTVWLVALLLAGSIAQIIFWFKHIRKTHPEIEKAAEAERKRDFWNT